MAGPGLPVVAVEHVHGPRLGAHRLQRGPAQEREPGAVVRVVAVARRRRARRGRSWLVLHEPQPIPVRGCRSGASPGTRSKPSSLPVTSGSLPTGTMSRARLEHRGGSAQRRGTAAGRRPPRGRGRRGPGPGRRRRRPGRRSWRTARTRRSTIAMRIGAMVARGGSAERERQLNRFNSRRARVACPDSWRSSARRSPRCPSGRCVSRPSCTAWSASRTTSTGRGTPRRAPCSAASTGPRGGAIRSPVAGAPGASRLVRRCSTTPTSWSSTGPSSPRTTRTGERQGQLVRRATTAASSTGPSPTSAPSSGSTSRWASTPAAWACSRATTARPPRTWRCRSWPSGLFYRHGYFRQTIDADGHQEHAYPDLDVSRLPLQRVADEVGDPLIGARGAARPDGPRRRLAGPGRPRAAAAAGHRHAPQRRGRPAHHPHPVRARPRDAAPPGAGAGRRWRPGAARAGHRARGVAPQRGPLGVPARGAGARAGRGRACPFEEALDAGPRAAPCSPSTRPVSAGNERFDADLVRTRRERPSLDAARPWTSSASWSSAAASDGDAGQFDMTGFSLRTDRCAPTPSASCTRRPPTRTWHEIVRPARSWASPTASTRGPGWAAPSAGCTRASAPTSTSIDDERPKDRFWERLPRISDEKLWDAHLEQKLELALLRAGPAAHPARPPRRAALGAARTCESMLDPSILTIGFARRFATYKRAALLFSDEERLARLLWDEERPVQIVFAGKAHPADRPGQRVIQDIFSAQPLAAAQGPRDHPRGLRHPRRPLPGPGRRCLAQQPAAAAGGVRHQRHEGGHERRRQLLRARRLVGRGLDRATTAGPSAAARPNPDEGAQDWADAQSLYQLLEQEIVPRWYDRDAARAAAALAARMRESMATLHLALLDRADARGVRRADVPAGGQRHTGAGGGPGDGDGALLGPTRWQCPSRWHRPVDSPGCIGSRGSWRYHRGPVHLCRSAHRRRPRLLMLLAAIAISVVGCAGVDPARPGDTTPSSRPRPAASVSQTVPGLTGRHADPELEALLPETLGGVTLMRESQRGTELSTRSPALETFLADLGSSLDQFSLASAYNGGGFLKAEVGAWRIPGSRPGTAAGRVRRHGAGLEHDALARDVARARRAHGHEDRRGGRSDPRPAVRLHPGRGHPVRPDPRCGARRRGDRKAPGAFRTRGVIAPRSRPASRRGPRGRGRACPGTVRAPPHPRSPASLARRCRHTGPGFLHDQGPPSASRRARHRRSAPGPARQARPHLSPRQVRRPRPACPAVCRPATPVAGPRPIAPSTRGPVEPPRPRRPGAAGPHRAPAVPCARPPRSCRRVAVARRGPRGQADTRARPAARQRSRPCAAPRMPSRRPDRPPAPASPRTNAPRMRRAPSPETRPAPPDHPRSPGWRPRGRARPDTTARTTQPPCTS